ncbi:hypothetical protein BurMR1_3050 [Burkholderia sp. MR1]|nr:hypothetical protein BurMR1_3050 [Burkholderia sp. MR1]
MSADDLHTLHVVPSTLTEADLPGSNTADLDYTQRRPYEATRQRLDRALQACGEVPFAPQHGETPESYRRRLLGNLAVHTETHRRLDTRSITADSIDRFEMRIAAEALAEPARKGTLAPIHSKDRSGRQVTEYVGDIASWLAPFKDVTRLGVIHRDGVPQPIPTVAFAGAVR